MGLACQPHQVRIAASAVRLLFSVLLLLTLLTITGPPAVASVAPFTPAIAESLDPVGDAELAIAARYEFLGGPGGVLGASTSAVTPVTGGFRQTFTGGSIYFSTASGAYEVLVGPMLTEYVRIGAETSRLGYPTGSAGPAGVSGASMQPFASGRLYWAAATGTHAVYGAILARYLAVGGPAGTLGLPTHDEVGTSPAGARVAIFGNGRISWSAATGAWELTGGFLDYFRRQGYSAGRLGLPTSSRYSSGGGATVQNFTKGRIYYTDSTSMQGVFGSTLARYVALGGSGGVLGVPTKAEHAGKKSGVRVTEFRHGRIWYTTATGAREVYGYILSRYLALGAETSRLGLPTGFRSTTQFGLRQSFQNGSIQYSNSKRNSFVRLTFKTAVTTPTSTTLRYSYRSGCPVKPADLRVLKVPFRNFSDHDDYGTIVVRSNVVSAITAVFMAAHAKAWPIHRLTPVEAYQGSDPASMRADNTSAFNCRKVTGNPYRLSQHSYGNAIDINPFENPYVTASKVYPEGSGTYLNRGNHRKGMLRRGDPVESTMRSLGWPWGARWQYPDYQHFSVNGA